MNGKQCRCRSDAAFCGIWSESARFALVDLYQYLGLLRYLMYPCSHCYKWFHSQYENTPIQIYWNFITKNWKFSDKHSNIFHISNQNIDCGYSLELPQWGGSNEYPQSMFLRRNKKNNVFPCKPQFYYIKVGFKESNLYRYVFMLISSHLL